MSTIIFTNKETGDDGNPLNKVGKSWRVKKGQADAWTYTFETNQIIESIENISAYITCQSSAGITCSWYWSAVDRPSQQNNDNSDINNRISSTKNGNNYYVNSAQLKAQWESATYDKKYICVRVGATTSSTSWVQVNVNGYKITVNGTVVIPNAYIDIPYNALTTGNRRTIYNNKPHFSMHGTDPANSTPLKYYYKIDDATSWTCIDSNASNNSIKEWQLTSALSAGNHTLKVKVQNNYDTDSNEVIAYFNYTIPTRLTTGTQIQRSQMATLKTYIDNLFNYYGISSNITITVPSQGSSIQPDDWTSYKSKISAAPYVSNSLNEPAKNNSVVMNNYNSYITILENG